MTEHTDPTAADLNVGCRTETSQWGNEARTERLTRAAVVVEADRAELYEIDGNQAHLRCWWAAPGHLVVDPEPAGELPATWFPWSLGNLRRANHVFVQNAGPLPLNPERPDSIADLVMASALYVPLHDGPEVVGGLCLYWANERASWPMSRLGRLARLARDTLEAAR